MTSQELHDHVSQWPEGARAKGLRLHTAGWFVEDRETGRRAEGETLRVDFQFCNPTTAIALHVASGVEWLLANSHEQPSVHLTSGRKRDGGAVYYDVEVEDEDNKTSVVHSGPTLFHAIHKAIIATKENA